MFKTVITSPYWHHLAAGRLVSSGRKWTGTFWPRVGWYRLAATQMVRSARKFTPPTIVFEDNGPGIAQENRERVFRSFFSLKEKAKRRGLGLFIAQECANYVGGSLTLDPIPTSPNGRLNRFMLELPLNTTK